jgi:hypothetical protein
MSSRPNCYEVVGQEAIEGIPLFTSRVSFQAEPPVGGDRRLLVKERVVYGRPRFMPKQELSYISVCSKENVDPKYWIVYVEVPALNFGGEPFLERLNLWPGGEWHNKFPFWRKGPPNIDTRKLRQSLDRAEVWVLKYHEQILLVDQFGGVRVLKLGHGQPQFSEVSPLDMADYLCKRGEAMNTHTGVFWAFKNLERMREGFPDMDFGKQLASVRMRLADFEVKTK